MARKSYGIPNVCVAALLGCLPRVAAAAPAPDATVSVADTAPSAAPDELGDAPADAPAADADSAPEATAPTEPEPEPEPAPEPQPEPVEVATPEPAPEDVAATKPDACRDGVSDLVPDREMDLMCPHEVDASRIKYKPGTGLVITSADDRFEFAPRLRAQFLYTVEHDGAASEVEQGLEIRRARLQFKGHMFNKHNKYKVEFAVSPRDMAFDGETAHRTPILDWYHDFTYLQSLTFRVGQYKVPFSRQRVISSGDLELVDRALAQGEFNLDRDIGFDFRSKDFLGLGWLRYYAGMWMGEGRDYRSTGTFEFMYIGRVEVLPLGMFEDYEEADFERSRKPRLSIGAAYAFIDAAKYNRGILGDAPSDGGTTDTHNMTADVMFKFAGLSASGEFYWRDGVRHFGDATVVDDLGNELPAPRERARRGIGWFGQVGYLIPRIPLGVAARYSQTRRLEQDRSTLPEGDEVGGGISYYFGQHPLKLQLDYFHGWQDQQLALGTDRIRLQLQASF